MELAHNVVLLRCPDSDKEFTPVSLQLSPSQHIAPSSNMPLHSFQKLEAPAVVSARLPSQGDHPLIENGNSKPARQS